MTAVKENLAIHDASKTVPALTRIDQHAKTLDRAVHLTQMADAKTAPVLALQATLAAVTVSQSNAVGQLLNPDQHSLALVIFAGFVLALYACTALLSCILGVLVYLPRAPRAGNVERHDPVSLVYFDDIRRMSKDSFREKATAVAMDEFEQDILSQVHTVSGVAALKMAYVRLALFATIVCFLSWLPLVAWAQA